MHGLILRNEETGKTGKDGIDTESHPVGAEKKNKGIACHNRKRIQWMANTLPSGKPPAPMNGLVYPHADSLRGKRNDQII
jgi:hypothetical protein